MKNTLIVTFLLFLLVNAAKAQEPYRVRQTKNWTFKYYRENLCTVSPGSTIRVKTPRIKGSKESSNEGGSNDGYVSDGNERIEFGHRNKSSDKSFEKEDEDTDDEYDSTSSNETEERTVTSEPPSDTTEVSKITFTEENNGVKQTQPIPPQKPRPKTPPVNTVPPKEKDSCESRLTLRKFYKDSTKTEYVLTGLEIRKGLVRDTFAVIAMRGSTVRMNVTSRPRIHEGKGRNANNDMKPSAFTEALFASGAGKVQLFPSMIVITKTKAYDPCKTLEVIEEELWGSIYRVPSGPGKH